jgi:hypothetical protein
MARRYRISSGGLAAFNMNGRMSCVIGDVETVGEVMVGAARIIGVGVVT